MTDAGWVSGPNDAITDVAGIRVGHWTDRRAATGCTVILCERSTHAAVDARGGAPGTREIDVLQPANLVRRCDAIVFAGGSAFGLAAATGVMRWCAERDIGFATTAGHVPIVSGAVIFDLAVGTASAFPGEEEGYRAAGMARAGSVRRGSVGAGTGATVAKLLGAERALKGGLGTSSVAGPRGLLVGALAVVNAVGHVFDPDRGELIAGPRCEDGCFIELPEALRERRRQMEALVENTTLVCVATNATLEHGSLQRLAYQAHDGLARTIVPAHTAGDGDVAFAVAISQVDAEPDDGLILAAMTTHAVQRAIIDGVCSARGLRGVLSRNEYLMSAKS